MKPVLALLLTASVLLPGCITFYGDTQLEVRVLVTEDVGTEVRTDEIVHVPEGASVLDALRAVATVETGYGGGFVEAIDGIESRYPDTRIDWFYHVDGRLAQVGAASYDLSNGDVVVWDHRPWNRSMVVPAVLTGLDRWPDRVDANGTLSAETFAGMAGEEQRYARVAADGDLVVLDAWGVASQVLGAPWALAHATLGSDGQVATLVVTTGPEGDELVPTMDGAPPDGVGLAVNRTLSLGVPG